MSPEQLLLILLLLLLKHFIVDFPLQAFPYQYKNKGTCGHPGGLLHSGLHAWATYLVIFLFFDWPIAIMLGLLDGVIHYHIDWAKMNLNKKLGFAPNTHEQFWVLLGFDQFLHSLTYLLIIFILL